MRVKVKADVVPLVGKNFLSVHIYYKSAESAGWTESRTRVVPEGFSFETTGLLLDDEFSSLQQYQLQLRVGDYFETVEAIEAVSTKRVVIDVDDTGTGMAFGKISTSPGVAEFAMPIAFDSFNERNIRGISALNLLFIGRDPIGSVEEDTAQAWLNTGIGYAFFSKQL